MADEDKSGMETLRDLAADASECTSLWAILKIDRGIEWDASIGGAKLSDVLRSIADRIEREAGKRPMPADFRMADRNGDAVRIGDRVDRRGRASKCCGVVMGYAVGKDGSPCFVVDANAPDGCAAGTWRTWLFRCCECCVKRPEPDMLGADGLPIKAGETVYYHDSYDTSVFTVAEITPPGGYRSVRIMLPGPSSCDGAWVDAPRLTHTPPETQERIDEDARLKPREYWEARGEKGKADRLLAQKTDLLRRQRILDAKTMGGDAS